MTRLSWHIIGEYPPQPGGVSDYTSLVAAGLAQQGDEVHVWCMPSPDRYPMVSGVTVHKELGTISPADLRRVSEQLDHFAPPRRLLVQWVPHAYGYRSMNLGFCYWLLRRARSGDCVEIMAHESYLPFGRNWKQTAAALVHRLMTVLVLRAAAVVWISIPEWEERFKPYTFGRPVPFRPLPIPSNIPVVDNPNQVQQIRRRYAPAGEVLIGHFGTHGWPITPYLEAILEILCADRTPQSILLMGDGSHEFRADFVQKNPQLGEMIHAAGKLAAEDISSHLTACDLMIQPYPDGVSGRRGSVMGGLAHGKPIVSTYGDLTSPAWRESRALALAPAGDIPAFIELVRHLRGDREERFQLGLAARKFYDEHFDLSHTIQALRGTSSLEYSGCAS